MVMSANSAKQTSCLPSSSEAPTSASVYLLASGICGCLTSETAAWQPRAVLQSVRAEAGTHSEGDMARDTSLEPIGRAPNSATGTLQPNRCAEKGQRRHSRSQSTHILDANAEYKGRAMEVRL